MRRIIDDEYTFSGDKLVERLKERTMAQLGKIKLNRRNILMFSGISGSGKTAIAIQLTNSAILNGFKVLYYDLDNHRLVERQVPNLLSQFVSQNQSLYNEQFIYRTKFDEDEIITEIQEIHPSIVVFDNIYSPFVEKYPPKDNEKEYTHSMRRAKIIKHFLIKITSFTYKNDISVIITSPATKSKHGLQQLGGEIVKAIANTKYFIDIPSGLRDEGVREAKDGRKIPKKDIRMIIRDNIEQFAFEILPNGEFKEI